MIDTLSAVTRERLRLFMRIMRMAAIIGAGVGTVYVRHLQALDGFDAAPNAHGRKLLRAARELPRCVLTQLGQ